MTNFTAVFKKVACTSKNNYQPVSCKLFELLVNKQLSEFFGSILSKFHCVFRKGYGAQHLLNVLETWKEPTDNNKAFGALLMSILKSFDC